MNKVLLITVIIVCSLFSVFAQSPCLPEGIAFNTQSEIDNFPNDYPDCTEIEGEVIVSGANITNLNGLNALIAFGSNLIITLTYELENLSGLGNVISIEGNLSIESNINLISLSGLNNLTYIGGFLSIYHNAPLLNLTGLDNLTSIGGSLKISHHTSLTSITNLSNLTSIGGDLRIMNNYELLELIGLENINAESIINLYITYNSSLGSCSIQSICDNLLSPNGTIEIHNNSPGCNSLEEVEDECWTKIVEIGYDDEIIISPNPFGTTTVISYTLNQNTPTTIEIRNINGQGVETIVPENNNGRVEFTFDGSGLMPGVYLCVVKTNKGTQTRKMVKMQDKP